MGFILVKTGRSCGRPTWRAGLAYVDAHADFATPEESLTGSVASMDLALAVGRGDTPLARLSAGLERLGRDGLAGFWVHVDADVLDQSVMPAVDSPLEDGLGVDELLDLLGPLVEHPRALGMQLTIYDPSLDPERAAGGRLVGLLERALRDPDMLG